MAGHVEHWGSDGCTCAQSTGATGAMHPQAGCLSFRWDCGWARDTFHEVNAISLQRDSSGLGTTDPNIAEWRKSTGIPLDMGMRGNDIVSEQYASTMKMRVERDGTVISMVSQQALEASRSNAAKVEVGDSLRDPSESQRNSRRMSRMSSALRIPESVHHGRDHHPSHTQHPSSSSDITLDTLHSLRGDPRQHD